jgi:hypothetical protein
VETIVGIFTSRGEAEQAAQGLKAIGLKDDEVTFLSPASSEAQVESLPTTDAEAPGMGKALGAYVGGVVGAGAGLTGGAMVAALLVPGLGPILAGGFGAAALLGLGGAVAGGAAGAASEEALDTGVPRDDVLFFRDLLKLGRSLVVASVDTHGMEEAVRAVFNRHAALDVNAAKQEWEARRGRDRAA